MWFLNVTSAYNLEVFHIFWKGLFKKYLLPFFPLAPSYLYELLVPISTLIQFTIMMLPISYFQ